MTEDLKMCDLKKMDIDLLPVEVLLEIHRLLPPSAMKMVTLVNKLWSEVGEHPTLWEKFTVTVYSKEDVRNLSMKRLRRIEEVSINSENWDAEDWNAFFRAVTGLCRLKKIDRVRLAGDDVCLARDDVKLIDPRLFARSLAKLEDVAVEGCTDELIQALFSEMSKTAQIKKIRLDSCHLSQLDPRLFGKVLSRLEDLDLTFNYHTKEQIEALFTEILNKSSLKRLVLNEDNWRDLDPEPGLFAKALSKVEDVFLTDVPDHHLEALFNELSFGNYQLKKLEIIEGGNFSRIETPLVAHVLSRMEELRLEDSTLSDNQVRALFTEMSDLTQMKKLSLVRIDLSQLDAGLFGRVMARLEDVNLCLNNITAEQIVAFFTEMSPNSHLKTLNIHSADLSSVGPDILAKAVTRLKEVSLEYTPITSDQLISLFAEMSPSMLMKKIGFSGNDLSSVHPQDFARGLMRMEEVNLCGSKITHDQAMALFRELALNTQLKKLKLGWEDLASVEAEVIASALIKVMEVDLSGSILSIEQIDTIFKYVLESKKTLKQLHLDFIGAIAEVDPERVRKVKEKLKGELSVLNPEVQEIVRNVNNNNN